MGSEFDAIVEQVRITRDEQGFDAAVTKLRELVDLTAPVSWQQQALRDIYTLLKDAGGINHPDRKVREAFDVATLAISQGVADGGEAGLQWQPIETAPKAIKWSGDGHGYGPYVLAWPVFYEVARVRWWQSKSGASNFLEDGGNAVHPTHWMPLPDPPALKAVGK